jgi:ribosome biogenesis GTPase
MNTSLEGQIIAAYVRQFTVELPDGKNVTCVTRGKKSGVARGDRVRIALTSPDQGIIEAIEPRKSLLYRSDAFREKIVVANVTQIMIVLAAVPSFYENLVNRCLVAAEAAKIKALIVLNKADLIAETRRLAAFQKLVNA